MLCCVVTTVGYPGGCVLSAFRDGVARILREELGSDPQLDAFLALAPQYLHVPA